MASRKSSRKPSLNMPRSARLRNALSVAYAEADTAGVTAAEMHLDPVTALRLEKLGYLVRKGTIETGRRGRPAVTRKLSKRARHLGQQVFEAQNA